MIQNKWVLKLSKKMKKILILLAVFVGVVGLVIGSFLLMGGGEDLLPKLPREVVQRYQKKIDKYWQAGVWSPECYDTARAYLYSGRKKLQGSFITLLEYNDSRAIGIIDTAMVAEWAKPNCDPSKVRYFYDGLKKVKSESKSEGGTGVEKIDNRVPRLDETYKLYRELLSFIQNDYEMTANYPSSTSMAELLRSHHSSFLGKKTSLGSSKYYSYLKNITSIKEGLANTEERLCRAEKSYFERMIAKATRYYENISGPITSEQFISLKSEVENFKGQVSEATSVLIRWMPSKEASLNSNRNRFNNKTADDIIRSIRSLRDKIDDTK